MVFEQVVEMMADMSLFQLFFPWLLVLAVTYGVFEKYEIFSDEAGVNGTIAIAVSFISVGGAYFFLPDQIMTNFAAALTFSVFGLLGLMILMAVAGVDIEEAISEGQGLLIAGILALISFIGALVFRADLGNLLGGVENIFDEVVMPIFLLVFIIVIVAITVGGGEE